MNVPLVDLVAGYRSIREPLLETFDRILDSGQLFLGPHTRALEAEFASYCGAALGLALSSGTDALYAALRACEIGPGDEVICPSLTFFASVEAIVHVGATPVLVDVSEDTLTLDPEGVRSALSDRTRAIMPVHLHGQPADMGALGAIARERGLRLIEDAAQAHGATVDGRRAGGIGDAGCFSFYLTKNLGAFGEGGFLATSDAEVAERAGLLRHHGHVSKFEHAIVGHNLRMDELQCAVLRLKLARLDAGNARRRDVAARYCEALDGLPLALPRAREGTEPVHHCFVIRTEDRDGLRAHLDAEGVGTGVHYAVPAHRQPALANVAHRVGPVKVCEEAARTVLSLPIYPEIQDEQVAHVVRSVRGFFGVGR